LPSAPAALPASGIAALAPATTPLVAPLSACGPAIAVARSVTAPDLSPLAYRSTMLAAMGPAPGTTEPISCMFPRCLFVPGHPAFLAPANRLTGEGVLPFRAEQSWDRQ